MLRPLTLAAVAVLVAHAAHAAPAPRGGAEGAYFPIKEGATRVYEVRSGDTVESGYTDVVTKVEKKDAAVHVTVTRDYPGANPYVTTIAVSGEGLFRVAVSGRDLAKPILLLKLPAKVGTKWELDGGARYEVTKEEEVEVPAGKFRAVRVEQVNGDSTTTLWFAPSAGLVKMSLDGGPVTVLKEFKPGK